MKSTNVTFSLGAASAVAAALVISPVSSSDVRAANQAAAALNCNLTQYKASNGLTSAIEGNVLTVSWNGQGTSQLRARFAIDAGTPTIRDLSVRRGTGEFANSRTCSTAPARGGSSTTASNAASSLASYGRR